MRRLSVLTLLLASVSAPAAWSQSLTAAEAEDLRVQLRTLREQQAEIDARMAKIEAALERTAPAVAVAAAAPAAIAAPAAPAPVVVAKAVASPWTVSGDLRLRYEGNFSDASAPNRDRGVLRARLRANYRANDWLMLGAQLATGDPDDPNSTDVTLSSFDDDLQVSLDQVYARATFGGATVTGGKFPNPFVRTDLVWDGDINPEGLAFGYRRVVAGGVLKADGLLFLVDEAAAGPDSTMVGGQVSYESGAAGRWRFSAAAGYYDYSLRSVAGGDAGDFRTNRFRGGSYESDFDLVDVVGSATYDGFGPRWPLRVTGDFVKNLGGPDGEDTGFGVDVALGRAAQLWDWRVTYGYAEAETDAVLAAFSHDNTTLATDYQQHALALDYVVMGGVLLNATWYHYRRLDTPDWIDRVRLNLSVNF